MKKSEFKQLVQEAVREQLDEAIPIGSPKGKLLGDFVRDFRKQISFFNEDIKSADKNQNYIGRLEYISNLIRKFLTEHK